MPIARPDLFFAVDELRQAVEGAADELATWHAGEAHLLEQAGEADREWLRDRLADLAHRLGYAEEGAETSHYLASLGQVDWDGSECTPDPHPHFAYFELAKAHYQAMRHLHAHGGGHGPWTWGVSDKHDLVWFADTLPGAEPEHIAEGIALMRADLAEMGIVLASELVQPPSRRLRT